MMLDLICMLVSMWIAYFIRHDSWYMWRNSAYRIICVLLVVVHICVVYLQSNYNGILRRGYLKEIVSVFRHDVVVMAVLLILVFFMQTGDILSRITIAYMFVISLFLMWIVRSLWKKCLNHQMSRNLRQVLLVSDLMETERILRRMEGQMTDFEVKGIVLTDEKYSAENSAPSEICGVPIVADASALTDYLMQNTVDELLFASSGENGVMSDLILACSRMGITIHMELMTVLDHLPGVSQVEEMGGITVLTGAPRQVTGWETFLKRLIDIIGSLFGLAATGILFLFVAPAIYSADPGPIFFKQERVGKNGRVFRLYKFRSMYMDAEERKAELMDRNEMEGQMFKMENDPRVIGSGPDGTRHGIGHFLRSTSIDEFPQFWNVFIGDMSLVGTRPPTLEETKHYDMHHRARLTVKPGITGL